MIELPNLGRTVLESLSGEFRDLSSARQISAVRWLV